MTLCNMRETFVNKKEKNLFLRACTQGKQQTHTPYLCGAVSCGREPSAVTCKNIEKEFRRSQGRKNFCKRSLSGDAIILQKAPGSMTVEASFALSIFILVFASFLSLFGVLQKQVKKAYDMDAALQKICASASLFSDSDSLDTSKFKDLDLSFAVCGVTTSEDDITLSYVYYERISFFPEAIGRFLIKEKVTRRAWTGRVLTEDEADETDDEYVYITDNASVYHTTTSCTHLKLSVKSANSSTLSTLRNQYGAKYYACEKCGGGSGIIYIADEGDRYHSNKNCSGLKRSYKKVKKAEVNLPACSRCGGG